jgi:CRISPR system Cascade subunit CasD
MSNLTLYLDGPLQGWGYMADHKYRNCLSHPTRSGVTGILAAAMGINRAEPIDRLGSLAMTILGLGTGRQIRDYHTAQTRNRQGAVVGHAEVTHRGYLVDSKFLVLLDGEAELLDEIEGALRDPVWFGTLGRRSCVPASPILLGRFNSEAEAIEELERRTGKPILVTLRVEETSGPGAMLLRDLPLSFGERHWGQRMILVSSL